MIPHLLPYHLRRCFTSSAILLQLVIWLLERLASLVRTPAREYRYQHLANTVQNCCYAYTEYTNHGNLTQPQDQPLPALRCSYITLPPAYSFTVSVNYSALLVSCISETTIISSRIHQLSNFQCHSLLQLVTDSGKPTSVFIIVHTLWALMYP